MKGFSFERLPSPPRNIGRLGFVTQLRFSSSESMLYLRVIPQSCSATIGCFFNHRAEIRFFSSFSFLTHYRPASRGSKSQFRFLVSGRPLAPSSFFEIQNHGRALKRCAFGEAFRNSARGERLERKMGRNVLVLFHGDKCSDYWTVA